MIIHWIFVSIILHSVLKRIYSHSLFKWRSGEKVDVNHVSEKK